MIRGYSDIHCVCCSEYCRSYSYFPSCDPLLPVRPLYRFPSSPWPRRFAPQLTTSVIAPNGCYRKVKIKPASSQLDLFGGAL